MSRSRVGVGVIVSGLLLAGAADRLALGAAGRTVWDGVYTTAQAERGRDLYAGHCSSCHGDFLDGDGVDGRVVALAGTTFEDNWDAASVYDLFAKIDRTMPRGAPGSLGARQSLDLAAFLLQSNGYPAGRTELADSADLALVDIVGRDGPRPLRIGSGVRTVGCLSESADGAWALVRASAPVRTRNPAASTGPDVERARTTPPGSTTIRLTGAKPGAGAGARVEVKGVLSSMGTEPAITVLSLQVVSPACE